MKYEVRASGGTRCETCGATALIAEAHTSAELAATVAVEIDALVTRNPLTRRRVSQFKKFHAALLERLRNQTFLA